MSESCSVFNDDRKQFLRKRYRNQPNSLKFNELMNSKNLSDLNNLCKFIRLVNIHLGSPG